MNSRTNQKQDTRRRIVSSAAQAIREKGVREPSIGEVMGEAGLTVGGFYAHFESKDALLLEALRTLMDQRMREWLQALPAVPAEERRKLAARGYLSRKHRDGAFGRCPMPLLLGELDRVDPSFRDLVAEQIERWAQALSDTDDPQDRTKALASIATMVGALSLARAFGSTPFSDELLAAAKTAVR